MLSFSLVHRDLYLTETCANERFPNRHYLAHKCSICWKTFAGNDRLLVFEEQGDFHKKCIVQSGLCSSDLKTIPKFTISLLSRQIFVPIIANPLITTFRATLVRFLERFFTLWKGDGNAPVDLLQILIDIYAGEDAKPKLLRAANLLQTILGNIRPTADLDLELVGEQFGVIGFFFDESNPDLTQDKRLIDLDTFWNQVFELVWPTAEAQSLQQKLDSLFLQQKKPVSESLAKRINSKSIDPEFMEKFGHLTERELIRLARLAPELSSEIHQKIRRDDLKILVPVTVLFVALVYLLLHARL